MGWDVSGSLERREAIGFKAELEKAYGPVEVIPYHDLDLARPELKKK